MHQTVDNPAAFWRSALDRLRYNSLELYRPYPKQAEFHKNGATKRERLFAAGNQCLTPNTVIQTVSGERRLSEMIGAGPFGVRSWDGVSRCVEKASRVFLVGIEPAFSVHLDNGEAFECSGRHQVLTASGWVSVYRIMLHASVLHSKHREQDLMANYDMDYHQDDLLLRQAAGNVSKQPLALDDAHGRMHLSLHMDVGERISEYIHAYPTSFRHSIVDDADQQLSDLCENFGSSCVVWIEPHNFSNNQGYWLFPSVSDLGELNHRADPSESFCYCHLYLDLSSCGVATKTEQNITKVRDDQLSLSLEASYHSGEEIHREHSHIERFCSCPSYQLIGSQQIIDIRYAGVSPILDFQVPGTNCYEAAGVIHHNCGKTVAGSMELAMHLTGIYPSDWSGRRWDRPTVWWAAGITGETTRDSVQRMLLGRQGAEGTGSIPRDSILSTSSARGVADLVDTILVQHVTGGVSQCTLKTYEKGREKWQAETLDGCWFDEEPPYDIYTEGLTRTNASGGIVFITFTPLLGMSDVVRRFWVEESNDRAITKMDITEAIHIDSEQRRRIIDSYLPHEREARAYGIPVLGSGRVFPIEEAKITIDAFPIPKHWAQIGGLDFGIDHPTAAVRLCHDRDDDVVYIDACYRVRDATPLVHCERLKPWGTWMPWAWPHDGLIRDKGSGMELRNIYSSHGLSMLPEKASFSDGSYGVEAGLAHMLERMQTGRFKVFSHLHEFFDEFRLYHRKDGVVVKERDDILAATRYAIMMLRYARTKPEPIKRRNEKGRETSAWAM